MNESTRERIVATFDRELAVAPVPPALRSQAIRAAVAARRAERQPSRALAFVAVLVAIALVATFLVIRLHPAPVPALKPSGPPPPRPDAAVTYDAAHGQLVVFGGNSMTGPLLADTWTWDGKHWTHPQPKSSPPARMDGVSAYDELHHVVVLFGGRATTGIHPQVVDLADTWTWDGRTWTQQHPARSPQLSYDWPATMGYDPISRSVLLFGFAKITTSTSATMTPETWSWNGKDWTQLNPAATPQSTADMFSDGTHLFLIAPPATAPGGGAGSHFQFSEWDGRSWVAVASQNDLPDSGLVSAAYDTDRHELVALNGDTWTWAQSRWVRLHPDQQPPTGYMTYFAPLHEVISWGERWGSSSNTVWAWNGGTWVVVAPGTVPPQPTPSGQFGSTTPAAADTFIRQSVKSTSPVLLPAWLPDGMDATGEASADGFTVTYRSDQRDKQISLGIVVANPGPGNASSSDTAVKFRNALPLKYRKPGYAEYFVYDPATSTSARWLMWLEPGTMANPQLADAGVPYFLSATGLTDQEFWQVANSLR